MLVISKYSPFGAKRTADGLLFNSLVEFGIGTSWPASVKVKPVTVPS